MTEYYLPSHEWARQEPTGGLVTIGLGLLIATLKGIQVKRGEGYDGLHARAARFWGKLFLLNYGAGVATGVPMEFQFGTNWARFSNISGGIIGQGLMMEGLFAFFLESAFLAVFLFGERRVSVKVHALSAALVATGSASVTGWYRTIISPFFAPVGKTWASEKTRPTMRLSARVMRANAVCLRESR